MSKPKANPDFTLGLTDEQKQLATEYLTYAHENPPERYQAGYEVERHGCGEVRVYLIDTEEDDELADAMFTPDELRMFVRELGQYWHDHNRLAEQEQNALHYFQLAASYAEGEVTKAEVEDLQEDFKDSHGFVRTGLNSLTFRKRHEMHDELTPEDERQGRDLADVREDDDE